MSQNLSSAFRYNNKETEFLINHPTILRKTNWGEYLTPEYLIELKKKQRQKGDLSLIIV